LVAALAVGCAPRASEPAAAPAAAPAQPEPPKPEAPPEPEAKPAARLPSDILSVPDKAWVFSFEGSAAYDKAKTECDEKLKGDPGARARCITKARDAFTADAMEFTRDDAGHDVWVIYRTQSNRLVQVYSVQIEYGEQGNDTVNIKKLGGEKGKPILFSDVKEFRVKLGGEYSLELTDAKHGLLAYDARLGFITTK
ncbi:MAG TPA: hypothetical protein VMG12_44575, partial [Polyangiaceae bacterium]|nr:hypothetical protein [Polyangiaceae bacterium]